MSIKTAKELATACENVAKNYKTLYVYGCFGAPMTAANKVRYCNNYDYNKQPERTAVIQAASSDTFGFDCVNLIKGLLWGWSGDTSKTYGGASYASNGVPDTNADGMIQRCNNVSTDFSKIDIGEVVWMSGHIGVYIGNGLAVECTPKWNNCVQITTVLNIGAKSGYNGRTWTKHGKLPYVEYTVETETKQPESATGTIGVNSVVAIKTNATTYYPGGKTIPESVKNDYNHIVTQITSNGKAVTKGGKVCYLLGKKQKKGSTEIVAGINSWVDVDNLELVSGAVTTKPESNPAPAEVKTDYAKSFDKALAGTYTVNSSVGLNLRAGASTSKTSLEVMPNKSKVQCYGYYTGSWLYVVSASGKKGFAHKNYLVKN